MNEFPTPNDPPDVPDEVRAEAEALREFLQSGPALNSGAVWQRVQADMRAAQVVQPRFAPGRVLRFSRALSAAALAVVIGVGVLMAALLSGSDSASAGFFQDTDDLLEFAEEAGDDFSLSAAEIATLKAQVEALSAAAAAGGLAELDADEFAKVLALLAETATLIATTPGPADDPASAAALTATLETLTVLLATVQSATPPAQDDEDTDGEGDGDAGLVGGPQGGGIAEGHEPTTVCHQTGDGPSHTLSIDENAVYAHLAHGDTLGPCGGELSEASDASQDDDDNSGGTPGPEATVCHSGSTLTVEGSAREAHLRHGDSAGPCDDASAQESAAGDTEDDPDDAADSNNNGDDPDAETAAVCHRGRTITGEGASRDVHLAHGDSDGACEDAAPTAESSGDTTDEGDDDEDDDRPGRGQSPPPGRGRGTSGR